MLSQQGVNPPPTPQHFVPTRTPMLPGHFIPTRTATAVITVTPGVVCEVGVVDAGVLGGGGVWVRFVLGVYLVGLAAVRLVRLVRERGAVNGS